jgi:ornithine carbamoyltransferase
MGRVIPIHLKGRDFLRVGDWSAQELLQVLELADHLKGRQRQRIPHRHLEGRVVGLLFRKPSTRTRVSFGVAAAHLGATAIGLGESELHLSRGEPLRDTALVLSRYLDGLVVRTHGQSEVDELAAHAEVPVVNALTDEFHPCQALADLMTIRERLGSLDDVSVAWVGDGTNVCHSLLTACALLGLRFSAATPPGYEPEAAVVAGARAAAAESGGAVELVSDPREAVAGADVVYTDVWTSMGQEAEAEQRRRDLEAYRVDAGLLGLASERAVLLHCLPAHREEEVTEEVLYGPRSAVWDQAENRLHTAKALMALVIR